MRLDDELDGFFSSSETRDVRVPNRILRTHAERDVEMPELGIMVRAESSVNIELEMKILQTSAVLEDHCTFALVRIIRSPSDGAIAASGGVVTSMSCQADVHRETAVTGSQQKVLEPRRR